MARTNSSAKALELVLPATSANLGPAFDAAALAFGLYLRLTATPANDFSITAQGRDADVCGNRENHLPTIALCRVLLNRGCEDFFHRGLGSTPRSGV